VARFRQTVTWPPPRRCTWRQKAGTPRWSKVTRTRASLAYHTPAARAAHGPSAELLRANGATPVAMSPSGCTPLYHLAVGPSDCGLAGQAPAHTYHHTQTILHKPFHTNHFTQTILHTHAITPHVVC
jgi:hypothetical protein